MKSKRKAGEVAERSAESLNFHSIHDIAKCYLK